MKYIQKQQTEPPELTAFKQAANENWQPTYRDLDKKPIMDALMREQGHICCYCESRLINNKSHLEHLIPQDVDDPEKGHIEHLVPQSEATCDPLDYANMLCSCTQEGHKLHCGMQKGSTIIPITPLEPDCEHAFKYTADGYISPADNNKDAKDTIDILRLDIKKLRDKRHDAIKPFLDSTLSPQEFNDFVSGYLQKDTHGRFSPFYTTIARIFTNG